MWHEILHVDVSVIEKLVRPVLIYGFLAVALRLAGKRELAQLNSSLDFIVLLAVASAVSNSMIGDDDSVTGRVMACLPCSYSTALSPCCCSQAQAQALRRRDASNSDQHGRRRL